MRGLSRSLMILIAGAALVSCTDVGGSATPVVRDSLGIAIIENSDVDLPVWTVDTVPVVSIGSVDGADGQDLGSPWWSARLSTGHIAISDGQSNQVRIHDAAGRFVRATGRRGDGPGEFRLVAAIFALPGDTLLVSDAMRGRLTFLNPDGEFARSMELEPIDGRPPRLRGLVGETVGVFRFELGGMPTATGLRRDTSELVMRPLASSDAVSLGRFPGAEWYDEVSPDFYSTWYLPFGNNLFTALSDSLLWIGVSDRYELHAYDSSGTLRRVVRLDRAPRTVTRAEQAEFFRERQRSAQTEMDRTMWQRAEGLIEFPAAHPAYTAIKADRTGHLWVREYDLPWSDRPSVWRVFREDGTAVALAHLPAGVDVHEIGDDYVLGRTQDAFDVEYIRLYALRRR